MVNCKRKRRFHFKQVVVINICTLLVVAGDGCLVSQFVLMKNQVCLKSAILLFDLSASVSLLVIDSNGFKKPNTARDS